MRKEREALLVATLAGLVIVGVAALVVQPTVAGNSPQRLQVSQSSLLSTTVLPSAA